MELTSLVVGFGAGYLLGVITTTFFAVLALYYFRNQRKALLKIPRQRDNDD